MTVEMPHLPIYNLWTSRNATAGPKPAVYKTLVNMEENGFPERVGQAFLQTAQDLQSVILSRVPGKPATKLIEDGYCLKSFYVHAKSCDWGPMAGFVAQLPGFNKKGVENIGYNIKEHVHSESKFMVLQAATLFAYKQKGASDPSKAPDPATELQAALKAAGVASSPFVHLGLTNGPFSRLFSDGYVDGDCCEHGADSVVGIAYDPKKTVLVEYLLLRKYPANKPADPKNEVWYAYHRNIYVKRKRDGTEAYEAYLKEDAHDSERLMFVDPDEDKLLIPVTGALSASDAAVQPLLAKLPGLWLKLVAKDSSITRPEAPILSSFYPVRVAQNPDRSYDEDDPRNAITGDYDLFAVWPLAPTNRWEETIRLAEGRAPAPPIELMGAELFAPVRGKKLTFELTRAPNVFIEVIPGFAEIAPWEDPILGNINDAVHLVVGMLNSNVTAAYTRNQKAPNAAFHSDEGGRPEVFEIEFPLAAFLPKDLRPATAANIGETTTTQDARALVITNADQFMSLIELLKGRANIPLAYGWLMHLLALVDASGILEALCKQAVSEEKEKKRLKSRQKYLEARQKERTDLGDAGVTALRARVWSLLTGYDAAQVLDKEDAKQAMAQATQVFMNLLEAIQPVYQMMTQIRAIKMQPPQSPP